MVASTLAVSDVAVIGINTEDNGNPQLDSITFILLAPVGSGTQIFFTDRSWSGTAFGGSGGGEGTFTYTAGADLPAGTVVTITQAQLTGAGINLSDVGETLYVYQGSNADTPTRFLHAVDIADGNTTFNGNLTNTGLVNGVSAVAIGTDNAEFGTRTHNIQFDDLFGQINNNTDWVQNDNSPQDGTVYSGGNPTLTAPDSQLWIAGSGAGEAIVTVNLDGNYNAGSLGYQIVHAFQNDANLFHPSDITLDTVHDRFFFVDSDISGGHNRIIEGSISQLLANPGAAGNFNVLYSDTGTAAANSIRTLSIDSTNGVIYFDHGTTFNKITYSLTGASTSNQTPTVLANLGSNNYVTQVTIDYTRGEVFLGSSRVTSVFGTDAITKNYIYVATGLTSGSSSLSFTQLPFNPDDAGLGPEGSPLSGEAWPVERGTIRGIDVDPVTHDLYIVTGSATLDNDGNGLTTYMGGVWRYDLDSNPTGNVTNIFTQNGVTGPVGLMYYIEVDAATGRYYVIDETGGAAVDDGGVWTGLLGVGGTPTLVTRIGNINGLGPQGLEIQHAPTLTSSFASTPTYTETAGADSPNGTPIILSVSHNSTDADSGAAALDQLRGAQVRISSGFQTGTEHQDVLTINGTTSGTIELGAQDISYSYNSATGVMTFTGIQTLDQYEAALALVRFRTDGDNPTNFGNDTSRTISFSTFDGLLYSDEQHVTVTVVGVNDAPINAVPGAQAINEDNTRVFSTANGNALSVSDVDADPATQVLQVTLSIADGHGTLTLGSITGLSFSVGDGTGDATMTFTGTANAINAALGSGGLTFTPTADYNGAAVMTFTVNDQGLNGTGGAQSDSDTVTINIAAVADIANDSATTNEDNAVNVFVQANDTFENAGHAITGVTQGANGTVTINDNGTVGNTADDYLVYTANADFNGTDSFTYTVTSGGVTETATVNVTVNAVADIANDTATTDEDNAVNVLVQGNDTFENPVHAITGFTQGANGTVSLNDNGTVADTTDDFLVYTPTGDFNGTDSFTYTVTSGGVTETATVNVTVNAVNDAPVAEATDGDYTATEQVALDIKNSGLLVSDIDSALGSVTVTLSVGYGVLNLTAGGTGVGIAGNGTSTVTLTGTVAAIHALLNTDATSTVSYLADGDDPPSSTSITLSISDQGNTGSGGVLTSSDDKTIFITPVDDLPVAVADGPSVNADVVTDIPVVDNDTDPDGGPKGVIEINGSAVSIGIPVTLASGATVTLNADGTIGYDPNGVFDYLVSPATALATGASNGSATDSFTYTLNGGSGTTVTVNVLGVDEPGDRLLGSPGVNTLNGTAGNDIILAFEDNDILTGGAGDDLIYGNDNDDTIHGGLDQDLLLGGNGDDQLFGDEGNDVLVGNNGNDAMAGGLGDDTYYIGDSGDVVTENLGEGTDLVRAQIDYTLTADVENLALAGGARSGTGNGLGNTIWGSNSGDTLSGLAGDDTLRGRGGRDTLLGGDGQDLLCGGEGKDTLTGGADRDVFQFRDGDMGTNRPVADVITDFSQADAEKIQLNQVDANVNTAGDQAFTFLGTGAFTGTAGELRYNVLAGTTWVSADTDGDGAADWFIGLTGTHTLTTADFVL